jgi:multidrug efflux pump subunit AcrA (membrane-fusion protein)
MRHHAAAHLSADGPAADPLRTRRFFLGGLAIGVVAMSLVGLATAVFIESPHEVAAKSAAPAATVITAVARWQVLRNPITVQGTVRSARTVVVMGSAPFAEVTVTRLPVKAGDRVRPGRIVAEIDGRPILLLRGRLPAYRNLHVGDHGPDVMQLQRALESLGYTSFDPPGDFGQSTALALLLFYRHLGYEAPVYHPPVAPPVAPGPGASPSAAPSSPAAAPSSPAAVPSPPAAQARPGRPGIASRQTATDLVIPSAYLPMSEVVFMPTRSALVATVHTRVGAVVGSGPLLTLATGSPRVTGKLSAHQAEHVRTGMRAEIVSASPPLVAAGTVTRIGALPAVGGPPASGYPVQVSSRRPLPQNLIGVRVRLTIESPVTSGPVLTVPLAAVIAAGHGRPLHVVKITPSRRRIRVAIYTGPSADGLVAVQPVQPGELRPGDRVVIGVGR